jgi:type VI secretion system protein ImpB
MGREGTVAPRDRVSITYKADVGGVATDVELPLRLLFVGDYTGKPGGRALEKRVPVSINQHNFDEVLAAHKVRLDLDVDNELTRDGSQIRVSLEIRRLADFGPDAIAEKVPELKKLLVLRDALRALRGPIGEVRELRQRIEGLLRSEPARRQLAAEIKGGK